jgi:hypothetical protein
LGERSVVVDLVGEDTAVFFNVFGAGVHYVESVCGWNEMSVRGVWDFLGVSSLLVDSRRRVLESIVCSW